MSQEFQQAVWTPGWYELDQSLAVGNREKFWFFLTPPSGVAYSDEAQKDPTALMFFNQLGSACNCAVRYARIEEITHPQLGPLLRVDTDGLDYIFVTESGREIVVNAEEEPGIPYDSDVEVENWSVSVKLSDVSTPLAQRA